MEERTLSVFTKGKERLKVIESMKKFLAEGNWKLTGADINEYYDMLDENSPEKNDLTNRFDVLAAWKNKQIKESKERWKQKDAMDRYDEVQWEEQLMWTYNRERALECRLNCLRYKLYEDNANVEYPL